MGQTERAIEVFREGLDLTAEDAGLLFGLSHAYARVGRGAEALDTGERAAALLPDDFHAQMHLGYLLSGAGLLERAEATFTRAERLISGAALAPAALADVLERLGRTEEAVAAAERAVALAPGDDALVRHRDALRGRLAASVEPVAETAVAAEPAAAAVTAESAEPAPEPLRAPPRAATPAPKKGTFSFLGW